jgi:hypothetical protein
MIDRQAAAWIAAAVSAVLVAILFLRRSAGVSQAGSAYGNLQKVTLVATAISVGALIGLGVFLLVSRLGG